jgi:hypothetical protein
MSESVTQLIGLYTVEIEPINRLIANLTFGYFGPNNYLHLYLPSVLSCIRR